MASHRTGYSSSPGLNAFGSSDYDSDFGYQENVGLNVAQADATSRRRSIMIQDILNPSDKEVR